ncbi:MAG TPA: transcriptional repressor [Clostridiales bacterium]|nr:transcriptional repressor [Clostridiales bacterium]
MKSRAELAELLRSHGLKCTRSREAVLGYLESACQPADAERIYAELRAMGIAVNLSTVYRTLESLCGVGLAKKVVLENEGRALFEFCDSAHRHYLVCICCKKIIPITFCPLGEYEQQLEQRTGYEITGHKLDVYGYCPQCKKISRA